MSLLNALREAIYPRTVGSKSARQTSPLARRQWRLAVEVLEDRLCLSGDLLVASFFTNSVLAYDGTQGTFLQPFTSGGNLESPVGVALGANDDVYVSGRDSNNVLHYDGNTGALLGTFVAPGSGGLSGPHDVTFGPDGNLYVNSGFNSSVLRYDGTSGAFLNTFVSSGSGGLAFPHGLTFGPDGDLYVADRNTNSVLRYDGTTGAFLGDFVSSGSGGLNIATGVVFGPDGNLYVDSFNTNSVLRYNGQTGAFLGMFASGGGLNGPQGLAFGPDGNLYVSSFLTNTVLRYNGTTGAFMDVFASGGNLDGPTYLVFRPTQSTTTLLPSANPLVFGQPVAFTATVSSVVATGGVPTGTVTFTIDETAQAPVPLSNGQATLSISTLSVGSHTIRATYNADPGFQGSTSEDVQETVNQADTTTTVAATTSSSVFGQPVMFTATVAATAPGAGMPTGTVTFSVDGSPQAPVFLSNGQATFTTSALSVADHSITATYNGDSIFSTSTSAVQTLTVNKADVAATLSSSADPSPFRQTVTFTASLAAVSPGAGTPTGAVTFTIDGTAQAPIAVTNGLAALAISTLRIGSHSITATYNGDDSFNADTSAILSQTVKPPARRLRTETILHSSADSSMHRHAVIFTANVTTVIPGAGAPTGTVTFLIDGIVRATVALVDGTATFTTSKLPPGIHWITVIYWGDDGFAGSASMILEKVKRPHHHHKGDDFIHDHGRFFV